MAERDYEEVLFRPRSYWGEIPEGPTESCHTLPNISEDIKKSMQRDCQDIYKDDESIMHIRDLQLPPIDPLVMYAIELHKWMNNMTETIKIAEVATEGKIIPSDAKVPIPEIPNVKLKHKQNNLNFMPTRTPLRHLNEVELEVPELSEEIVRKILTKCVAVLTAQIGFEDSFQSVLDVLVDVLEQFFIKVCNRFTSALNEEESLATGGFPNVLERVFVEMGLGGAKGLHDYYRCRVLKYISVLQKRCQQLEHYYSTLLVPSTESPTGEFGKLYEVRVKEETDEIDTDSELNFVEGDLITSGYQLLRNLEPEAEEMHELPEGND